MTWFALKSPLLLLALVVGLSYGGAPVPLKVEGDTVVVVRSFPITVSAPDTGKGAVDWKVSDQLVTRTDPAKMNSLIITSAPKGTYKITFVRFSYDKMKEDIVKETGETTIVVGDLPPTPGPTPPPEPTPPKDVPFAGVTPNGLRVLIVEESKKRNTLPASQISIIQGKRVRDYLEAKCPVGSSSTGQKEYWILDQDDDVSELPKHWQEAMKRAKEKKTTLPWILVGNGKQGEEGPLPQTVDETLTLLKKYGE